MPCFISITTTKRIINKPNYPSQVPYPNLSMHVHFHFHFISFSRGSRRLDPRTALVGCTEAITARSHVLAVPIAIAISRNAHAHTAHPRHGLRGTNNDLAGSGLGVDAPDQRFFAGSVKCALGDGVVVGCVDDVDGNVVV